MRFEPRLDGFLAFDARKFVLELRGLQSRTDLLFAFSQESTIFWTDLGVASGFAKTHQTIAQCGGGTASRSRRIVKLVSQAGGKFAEGRELLVLLLCAGNAANAVCQQANQAADKLRQSLKKRRELGNRKAEVVRGEYGAAGDTDDL